jgi:hypothetical protein
MMCKRRFLWRNRSLILHHNVSAFFTLSVTVLTGKGISSIESPPFSRLGLADFWLFPKTRVWWNESVSWILRTLHNLWKKFWKTFLFKILKTVLIYIRVLFSCRTQHYTSHFTVHNWVYWSYNVATCFASYSHHQAIHYKPYTIEPKHVATLYDQ